MTSIPLVVERIECKQLWCISVKNQSFFLNFFLHFLKFALNFEHFQKKMTLIAYVFGKLPTTKDMLR